MRSASKSSDNMMTKNDIMKKVIVILSDNRTQFFFSFRRIKIALIAIQLQRVVTKQEKTSSTKPKTLSGNLTGNPGKDSIE